MEYGPRALGQRTILAEPTDPTMMDWLNKRLERTEFMPFAPIILEEEELMLGRALRNYENTVWVPVFIVAQDLDGHETRTRGQFRVMVKPTQDDREYRPWIIK